ncbi:hypothetical protein DL764_008279 [Monosporascus ibericus]|uniref:Uncharacterized protein n=1 Tax=Monosporascus ibericus TaxID=155417 RepID=A0A4V1X9A9_9PEZI|nr:hypothetical protein DL764_008279 [Monosporascus ibericus]
MEVYLHESITPEVVREAKKAGITGIKSYPAGVTTNSSSGVISYEPFYPVFKAMEEEGLVSSTMGFRSILLTNCTREASENMYGDMDEKLIGITILNAEASFLPTLRSIHKEFPKLKIVLEHCTTKDAVEAVRTCGDTVVGTITSHHLYIIIDDAISDVVRQYCYCKPVAKLPHDRRALLNAVVNSKGKFFLGTDSAPHDNSAKKGKGNTPAGVFTQPYASQLVLTAIEEAIDRGDIAASDATPEVLQGFLCDYGRAFYGVKDAKNERITLRKGEEVITDCVTGPGVEVINFRRGKPTWSVEWK